MQRDPGSTRLQIRKLDLTLRLKYISNIYPGRAGCKAGLR
jgi:hypothetical protein